ncbi:MAG TPA: DVUA0089 family protein [Bryobacteraceae bacterium]|jgi:hypothetical protein
MVNLLLLRNALLVFLSSSAVAFADVSYTGTFTADDDTFRVDFSLPTTMPATVRTWSFAGGASAAGDAIPPGGFAPVVSLFDSSGNLLLFDDGGVAPFGCGPRNIDASTGFCLDAYINGALPAGNYTAVLTEFDNTPNGPTLADGFVEQGNGNFTGGPFLLNAGPGFQRTGNWELDVPGSPVAVPEPEAAVPVAAILCTFGLACTRRRNRPT